MKVRGQQVRVIRFADDQAMVASSNAGLLKIINQLCETSDDYKNEN